MNTIILNQNIKYISSLFKPKTLMNFAEFSFVLLSISTFKEFNKLYLINQGKVKK